MVHVLLDSFVLITQLILYPAQMVIIVLWVLRFHLFVQWVLLVLVKVLHLLQTVSIVGVVATVHNMESFSQKDFVIRLTIAYKIQLLPLPFSSIFKVELLEMNVKREDTVRLVQNIHGHVNPDNIKINKENMMFQHA